MGRCIQYDSYAHIKCPQQILGYKTLKETFARVKLEITLGCPTYTHVPRNKKTETITLKRYRRYHVEFDSKE